MSDERYIESPPAGADDWREIWREDRRYRPPAGSRELFLRAARRLVRSSLGPDADRQRDFNLALLDLLGDLGRDLQSLRDDLKRDLAAVQIDMRIADEAL
ncbi:MAG TPA: hypothetical protein VFL80_02200, partial [Thermoanaerobaculia bacterium]|nr:hypothetical protein [Thermoanaerobaculia bacterium]